MDRDSLLATWTELQGEFQSRSERVLGEFTQAWDELKTVLDKTESTLQSLQAEAPVGPPGDRLTQLLGPEADRLLGHPLDLIERRRPAERALAGVTELDSGIEDLLRTLPAVAEISVEEALLMTGAENISPLERVWVGRRRTNRIRLREAARTRIYRSSLRSSRAEGELLLALAEAKLHVVAAWQIWRQAALRSMAGAVSPEPDAADALAWWRMRAAALHTRATAAMRLLAARQSEGLRDLQRAVLGKPAAQATLSKYADRRRDYLQYWSKLHRVAQAQLELEAESVRVAREALDETGQIHESVINEHQDLIAELDSVTTWLSQWSGDTAVLSFPPPQAQLIAAEDRVEEWVRRISFHARQRLPATAESIAPRFPLPNHRVKWRQIQPERTFMAAAEQAGRHVLLASFREIESAHRAIVREIEHAREVFAFGVETARAADSESAQVAAEAVGNAIGLLEYQRRTVTDIRDLVTPNDALAVARLLMEYHDALDRDRLSTLAQVTQRRGLRIATRLGDTVHAGVQWTARGAERIATKSYQSALTRVGLMTPPREERQAVQRTAALHEILERNCGVRDLPAIYRRLFRLAPVEDPRFLVGRREELAGIAHAVDRWLDGQAASVMVVGARGSGKTSLLNCATQRFAAGIETLRGQFTDRIKNAQELQTAMCQILAGSSDVELPDFLRERKRIIVVEEFERIFLRTIDGFDAVRYFIDLMQWTSDQALWIVSTNESSYRFLCAACSIDQFFSHKISAMSVSQEAMTAAILQRHNLSGFRLEFAPVPRTDPRVSRMREFFGLAKDPEQLFFDSLHQQSEGIYRSAFELWQDCIERVEAGTTHMAQPLSPNYDALERELRLEDSFALHAVLQHGSLTPDELALVLRLPVAGAGRLTQRLIDLQIIETEPAGPGFRVKPQAGRFVRDVLHKRNLL